ncbi:MAG TPA: arginase [Candidatus Saccharimonadales bacterium]|nr:arginase [Candidatus Saccharimonadales bacterium]
MISAKTNNVTLIGAPVDLGAENLGVDISPQAFRYAKLIDKLNHVGFTVTDSGNVACRDRQELNPGNPRLRYLAEIVRVNEVLADKTEEVIRSGQRVIALGGDHSINLGAVSGASIALDGDLGLIYFDAHGDMNTDKTTLSGNIHGMHLASLMGFGATKLKNVHGNVVKIHKKNLLHIGGSDFDQAEIDLIAEEGLQTFTLFDMLSSNLGPLFNLIDSLATKVSNIWVSLDLDVIDRMYAPGAGMPNAKGLTYREIATIAEYIGKKCPVIGIDVVEYNPLQDVEQKTAELAIELIAKFLGRNYSWYTKYMDANKID